jgi:multidrug efflux pump
MAAALKGAAQIGFTLVSLTVSLVAVLIPLLFMGGVVGRLFHEFAITLAVSIMVSLVVSLTLTPMMCARMLPAPKPEEHGRPGFLDKVIEHYGVWLDWVLERQRLMLFVMLGTLVLTVVLYLAVPKGFFPVQDTGALQAVTEAPGSVSFAAMSERQQELAARILEDPDVAGLSSFIGVDGANATLNSGRMLIKLRPHGERDDTALEVMDRLRGSAREIPGINLYLQPVQELTI